MLSTKLAERFTPEWLKGQQGAAVYLMLPGSVIDRASLEAELTGEYQAGRVFSFELLEAFTAGVKALADEEDQAHLIALAHAEAGGADDLDADDKQLLDDAKAELARYWPAFRDLNHRMQRRREFAPLLAFRRFCVGWENVDVPFSRGRDGMVDAEALKRIDPLEMASAGHFAYGLLYPSDQEGNSAQPSPSDESPAPSTSDAQQAAAGTSTESDGKKTRASRSPRGSGGSSTSG